MGDRVYVYGEGLYGDGEGPYLIASVYSAVPEMYTVCTEDGKSARNGDAILVTALSSEQTKSLLD